MRVFNVFVLFFFLWFLCVIFSDFFLNKNCYKYVYKDNVTIVMHKCLRLIIVYGQYLCTGNILKLIWNVYHGNKMWRLIIYMKICSFRYLQILCLFRNKNWNKCKLSAVFIFVSIWYPLNKYWQSSDFY